MLTVALFCAAANHTRHPKPRAQQVLVASAAEKGMHSAFPPLLRTSPDEVLIAFKRGSPRGDTEAVGEMLRFDTARNAIVNRQVIAQDLAIHRWRWVRFPNGDIAVHFDVQNLGHDGKNYRTGMRENRSSDGARTFSGLKLRPRRRARWLSLRFHRAGKHDVYAGDGVWLSSRRPVVGGRDRRRQRRELSCAEPHRGIRRTSDQRERLPAVGRRIRHDARYGNSRTALPDGSTRRLAETDLKGERFMESHIGRPPLFARDGGLISWAATRERPSRTAGR